MCDYGTANNRGDPAIEGCVDAINEEPYRHEKEEKAQKIRIYFGEG